MTVKRAVKGVVALASAAELGWLWAAIAEPLAVSTRPAVSKRTKPCNAFAWSCILASCRSSPVLRSHRLNRKLNRALATIGSSCACAARRAHRSHQVVALPRLAFGLHLQIRKTPTQHQCLPTTALGCVQRPTSLRLARLLCSRGHRPWGPRALILWRIQ